MDRVVTSTVSKATRGFAKEGVRELVQEAPDGVVQVRDEGDGLVFAHERGEDAKDLFQDGGIVRLTLQIVVEYSHKEFGHI